MICFRDKNNNNNGIFILKMRQEKIEQQQYTYSQINGMNIISPF